MGDLQKIGLTKVEAKTYIGLIEIGEAKASEISAHTAIPTSNLYAILDSLHEKGLISISYTNNTKLFQASSPDALKVLFEKKVSEIKHAEKDLLDTISNLKNKKALKKQKADFRYFENVHGIKAMWLEIIDSMKDDSSEHKFHVGSPLAYENLVGFYKLYHKKRTQLEIPTKFIYDPRDMKLGKAKESELLKVKFQKSNAKCEWGIVNNKLFIQSKEKAFLIEDEEFVETFSEMFDKIWDTADEL